MSAVTESEANSGLLALHEAVISSAPAQESIHAVAESHEPSPNPDVCEILHCGALHALTKYNSAQTVPLQKPCRPHVMKILLANHHLSLQHRTRPRMNLLYKDRNQVKFVQIRQLAQRLLLVLVLLPFELN